VGRVKINFYIFLFLYHAKNYIFQLEIDQTI